MKKVTMLFRESEADAEELERYLREYDEEFIPVLASRVQISEYAKKISQNASVCWIEWENRKIGMCAIYMNHGSRAFITSINVAKEFCGQGLGSALIGRIIEEAKDRGMTEIVLSVNRANKSAVSFYEKNTFSVCAESEEWYQMMRKL